MCDKNEFYATLDKYINELNDDKLDINKFCEKVIFAFEHNHNKLELFNYVYTVTNFLVTKKNTSELSKKIIYMYIHDHKLTFEKTNLEKYNNLIDEIFKQYPDIYETTICKHIEDIVVYHKDQQYLSFISKYINTYIEEGDNLKYLLHIHAEHDIFTIYDFSRLTINKFFDVIEDFSVERFKDYIKTFYNKISEIFSDSHVHKDILINKLIECECLEHIKKFHEFTIDNLRCACENYWCTDNGYNIICYILDRKVIPDKSCFDLLTLGYRTHNELIVNAFLSHGYELIYEDVVKICKYGIEIQNFNNYDIKVNHEIFVAWCNNECKNTPNYIQSFKPTHEEFYNSFKTNLLNIGKFVKLSKWKVDITCLENACLVENNSKNINFILRKKINGVSNLPSVLYFLILYL
jgi:hypothetical protein